MRRRALLLGLLPLALSACASPKYEPPVSAGAATAAFASHAAVDVTWEKEPTETEMGSFLFDTYRLSPVDGAKVPEDLGPSLGVALWMPSMGHGSSPVTVDRLGEGKYRASNVFFVMRGAWEIHVQVKSGKETTDEAVLAYTF
jgi:hypothetical protein